MPKKCPHVDEGVIVGLENVTGPVTIDTDPGHGRQRLQSQVAVRVLEVGLHNAVIFQSTMTKTKIGVD